MNHLYDPTPVTVPLRRADPADAGLLSVIVATAFLDLAPSVWLIPERKSRLEILPEYFRLFVDDAFANGTVYTTPDRTAAALWITRPAEPPDRTPSTDYNERLEAATGPWADRFREFDATLDRHHPTGTEHHHLAILAVHPDVQHSGIGSALLSAHHRLLDAAGIAAYLEASDPATRSLYLRHGYRDYGTPIHLSEVGPLMYPMWRPPAHRYALTA